MDEVLVLKHSCRDFSGVIAAVIAVRFGRGGNINEAEQFDALEDGDRFKRIAFDSGVSSVTGGAKPSSRL